MNWIKLKPIFQERVWGGRALATELGKPLPQGAVIGESWEIVDRPEADSEIIDGGAYTSLSQFREERTEYLMGPGWPSGRPFPILVKWLDCEERLSLQVHPPAKIAPQLGGEPKTENWYIAKTKADAGLLAGLKQGVSREDFESGLKTNTLESLVHRIEVKQGDSLFVPSGRLHAIDAGNLILEIQQNSDTTYRVYDWGRVGLDGEPRQLHVDESLASIDFDDFEPPVLRSVDKSVLLADSKEFRLRKIRLDPGERFDFQADQDTRILSIVEGELASDDGGKVAAGDNLILPYGGKSSWRGTQSTTVLITDRFNWV